MFVHKLQIMKKILVVAVSALVCLQGFSQTDDSKKSDDYGELKGGFKQENIFIGGSINAGFGSGQFSIGGSPEIGYSFTPWLDAGLGLNINYTSIASNTYYNPSNVKVRQTNYGGGPFFRAYPVNFLFIQGQYEQNWTKVKQIQDNVSFKQTVNAPSLIAGIGYTQRVVGQGGYYIMVGLDLLKDQYSPYVGYNDVGQIVAQPIFRAGFNFYLRPSKQADRGSRYRDDHTL